MAEAYDAALRRRLDAINNWGSNQTNFAAQAAESRAPKWATDALFGGPASGDRRIRNGPGLRSPGQPVPGIRGGPYTGPKGNQEALRAFGLLIQSLGGRVSENSMFNGGHKITGGHTKNSRHYKDRALDINFGPGTSRKEQRLIDKYLPLAQQYGLRSIWRAPGHYNHWHVDY